MPKLIPFPSPKTAAAAAPELTAEERALAQRNAYVDQYQDLIEPIAKSVHRRLPPSFELDDLMQAGAIGLIHAAATYRRSKGSFVVWAKWRIRDYVLDAVRRKKYTAETCAPIDDGAVEQPPENVVAIDGAIRQSQMAAKVRHALELLPEEERTILEMYYFEERQLRGVGEFLGVGMSRSSQRVQMAREELRGRLRALGVTEVNAA